MLLGVLLVDPGLADDSRIAEKLFQLPIARFYIFDFCKHELRMEEYYADFSVFVSLPAYLFLNLSTRPAVSMIFCFPVMKGWHWEQISVLTFCRVDFVLITFPQTQVMVVSLYSG